MLTITDHVNLTLDILDNLVDNCEGMDADVYDTQQREKIDEYYRKINEVVQDRHIRHRHPNLSY